jgi:hypothetical protein
MAFLRLKTAHGCSMADAYSAFQKYVRRGDIDYALYWGAQIGRDLAGIKGYPNALKKRLLQHALEDIGHIKYAIRLINTVKKPTWDELAPWIVLFCQLPKTRAAAWINRVAVEYIGAPSRAPTSLLKVVAETLLLHRDGKTKELEEIYGKEVMKLYREINNEVLAFHGHLLTKEGVISPEKMSLMLPVVHVVDLETRREIPDWVYDKHTAKGKAMGRGYTHFLETMVVEPRLFGGSDPFEVEARALYMNGREQRVRHILAESLVLKPVAATKPLVSTLRRRPKIALELVAAKEEPTEAQEDLKAAGFKRFLQAQPITGRSKPRTWFATDNAGAQVVIKGPMPKKELEMCVKSEAVKVLLGLPNTNLRILEDLPYIIQDSLVDYTTLPTRTVTTKLEFDICVLENLAVPGWSHELIEDSEMAYKILEGLLFRKVVGANDACTRNFIVLDRAVYSIDDAALSVETEFMWKVALVKPLKKYQDALDLCWSKLVETIAVWREKLAGNKFGLTQLNKYSVRENWRF